MNAAVFFDKDGILNEVVMRGDDISSPRIIEEFRILTGAAEMVSSAGDAGFMRILATNQPDIERGLMTQETLREILSRVQSLGLDDIEVSYDGNCLDRRSKPNAGMLIDAAAKHSLDLSRCFFVGDTWRDVAAGRAAGVWTVLLRTGYNAEAHNTAHWDFETLEEIAEFLRTTAKDLAFGSG